MLKLTMRDYRDDYDSEFRFAGLPIASLQGLDAYQRVIYWALFQNLISRYAFGYMVLPENPCHISASAYLKCIETIDY